MKVENWQALLQRASSLRQAGRVAEAIAAYEQLLSVRPDLTDCWYNLGLLQRQARRFEDALASYGEALRRGVSGAEEVHLNRAVILSDFLNRPNEAREELQKALALSPRYVPALLNLGNLAEDQGRRDEAHLAYRRALDANPRDPLALARLAGVSDVRSAEDPLIGWLRAALSRPDLTFADRADLGFALGRLLDGAGAYPEAFEAYRMANAASRESLGPGFEGYDRAAHEDLVSRIIAAFPAPAPVAEGKPDKAPIFICGMFRSGSTLAEQILASHSGIAAGGELDLIPALVAQKLQPYPEAAALLDQAGIGALRQAYQEGLAAKALDRTRVTDKRPDNFLHIGLIKTLFPGAKIIHTRRDPLDNCLSLYFLHLDPAMAYALDLQDAAHFYDQHMRLMDHWKGLYADDIFEMDYDALVRAPKPTVAELLRFCSLEWESGCLDFQNSTSAVKTASVWQVRQPLYSRSSGRWRNYAQFVDPLRLRLGKPD